MKLREDELKTLYKRSLGDKPDGRASCPSENEILKSFTPEMSEAEKLRIVDHTAKCGACSLKFETAREIWKGAQALVGEFEGRSLSAAETAVLRQLANEKICALEGRPEKEERKTFVDGLRSFFLQYRYASVVAGLFMVAVAAWLVLKSPQAARDDIVRGGEETDIALEAPRGVQQKLPLLFRWRSPWPGGEAEVRLLNEELDVVWTSGRIRETSVEFPAALSGTIKPSAIYYWKVIVYLDDGRINESGLQEFKLKD